MTPGTYLSTRFTPIFVGVDPAPGSPDSRILGLHYGGGGKGKSMWWPDTPVCQAQIEQVFQWFTHDLSNLGRPLKASRVEEDVTLAAGLQQ